MGRGYDPAMSSAPLHQPLASSYDLVIAGEKVPETALRFDNSLDHTMKKMNELKFHVTEKNS